MGTGCGDKLFPTEQISPETQHDPLAQLPMSLAQHAHLGGWPTWPHTAPFGYLTSSQDTAGPGEEGPTATKGPQEPLSRFLFHSHQAPAVLCCLLAPLTPATWGWTLRGCEKGI